VGYNVMPPAGSLVKPPAGVFVCLG